MGAGSVAAVFCWVLGNQPRQQLCNPRVNGFLIYRRYLQINTKEMTPTPKKGVKGKEKISTKGKNLKGQQAQEKKAEVSTAETTTDNGCHPFPQHQAQQ